MYIRHVVDLLAYGNWSLSECTILRQEECEGLLNIRHLAVLLELPVQARE